MIGLFTYELQRGLRKTQNSLTSFTHAFLKLSSHAGFGKLSKLSRLETLDLSGNYFNASSLSSLSQISTLKSLILEGNDLKSNHKYGKSFFALLFGSCQ